MNRRLSLRGRGVRYAFCAVGLTLVSGCLPLSGRAFREAAVPALRTGVTSILTGLLDGVFAAIEVEPQSS